jgi:hypothetical protein
LDRKYEELEPRQWSQQLLAAQRWVRRILLQVFKLILIIITSS